MIETMAGGMAVFDYNNDGRPDVFFTGGAASSRLFRNQGDLKFTDVTAEARVAGAGSMGAAAADFDNDGFVDLFVAGVNRNLLYRNLGNGRFEDVTARSGILSDLWAVAAAWFDYDRDGRLDLFITHYSKWPPAADRYCGDKARDIRVYCHPKYFEGLPNDNQPNFLFRNPRRRNVRGARSAGRRRAARERQARGQHGRGLSRLRQRRPAGYHRDRARGRDLPPVSQRRQRRLGGEHRILESRRSHLSGCLRGRGVARRRQSAPRLRLRRLQRRRPDRRGGLRAGRTGRALGERQRFAESLAHIGATVRAGVQWNVMTSAVGYASSSHSGVHFGLGGAPRIDIGVKWPSGITQRLRNVAADQVLKVTEPRP